MQKLLLFSCFVFLFGNISFSQNIFKEKYIEKEWSKRKRQNEISGSQAIQILTREFSHIKGNRSSFSYSINDWDNTSKKFVKSHLEDLPILNTMKLSSDDLKVVAFAKQNEILKILSSKYNWVKLRQPGNIMPSNFGSWNLVETIDGKTGWVFSKPENSNFSNTTSINRPIYRPPSTYSKPSSSFPWFWTIVIGAICLYFFCKIFSSSSNSGSYSTGQYSSGGYSSSSYSNSYNNSNSRSTRGNQIAKKDEDDTFGYNDSTQYKGKSWLTEKKVGRTANDGTTYKGKSWLTEEKTGRIDKDGNIYKGKSWLTEEKTGRVDKDGNIYKGKSWLTEEKVGRIDKDGTTYKGKSWLTEEKTGRSESNSSSGSKSDSDCFLTTTCVSHKNLADDCYELQILRKFRDNYLGSFEEGIKHLKNYYEIAPSIISEIEKHPMKNEILEFLYNSLVIKSIILISEGKNEEAFLNYKYITLKLKSELINIT
ncbi:CFI-box-CTERM domain-containing protein [uncultured Dokdonia sp.]|uniref:CFI-box-CTERM domain-containing protein n=1 Tax=uncultured Dokdonia sp. TaxID=575653 RepID=UPI002625E90A|nr:CFI-box-CTERM domain-containing protein [uncultured Dokdonia sp.]